MTHLVAFLRTKPWKIGSPEMNGFYHIGMEMERNAVQAHHMLVVSCKVNGKIRGVEGWKLENAINCASGSLRWSGLLDDQRGKGHYRLGVNFMDKAQYLIDHKDKLSKSASSPTGSIRRNAMPKLRRTSSTPCLSISQPGEQSPFTQHP
jgi:hypothetical protein